MGARGFAAHYKRLRAKYFVIVLALSIATAIICHWLFGFDPDFGLTNLALSIEASVAMSLFMVLADENEAIQRELLECNKHLLEAQHALLQRAIGEEGDASCGSGSSASSSSPPSSE